MSSYINLQGLFLFYIANTCCEYIQDVCDGVLQFAHYVSSELGRREREKEGVKSNQRLYYRVI